MKKSIAILFLYFIALVNSQLLFAQENKITNADICKNSVQTYLGLFDWNISYERDLLLRPHSITGLRGGIGYMATYYWDEGIYLNFNIFHLIGRQSSHLELDAGLKAMTPIGKPVFQQPNHPLFPDVYAGYRYEKPDGRFLFRAGVSNTTLVNIGIGYKF